MKKLNCTDLSKIQKYVNDINIHKMTEEQHSALMLADIQLCELYQNYTKKPIYSKLYADRILAVLYDVIDSMLAYEKREVINEARLRVGDF